MINNDMPSITQITKDRETRIPLKVPVVNSGALEGLEVSAPHVTPVVLLGLRSRETNPTQTSGELWNSGGVRSSALHVTPVVLLGPYSTYNMLHTSARIYY